MGTITLKNFRTSSDVRMNTALKDGGVAIDWSTLSDIKAWLWSDAQKALAGRCDVRVDAGDDTNLICEYAATKPQYPGVQRLIVQATYMGATKTYDTPAFNFVRRTADQDGEQITIDDPEVDVTIEVTDVSSSILQEAIEAALAAADKANEAAEQVPLEVLTQARQATQEAREATEEAEDAAEHATPYIGENGHWWRWDKTSGAYVDTGEAAQGPTGNGIQSVEQTQSSQESEGENVVTVTMTDGSRAQFSIRNGKQGERGLQGVPGVANAKYKQVDTLPTASTDTMDFIYLTPTQTAGVYDMSYTEQDGNTYTWKPLGTTAIQLADYAPKAEVNRLEAKVSNLDEELHTINPHITGRIGMANNNEDVTVTDLLEYTGQYGVVTITSGSDGYLWCCLENDNFRVTSSGVEIPMVYVKEEGELHCFVSAEKIKAGVLKLVVEGIHPIKADTERVIITARSYTITYGDAIPEFGFIADAEVEGTPSITCEAVQGSNVGTYAIVISRGTVEDDNAIYVNGTLTIVKAELTITAENKQVEVGGTMPTFTVQYSGFVLDDDASDLTTQPICTTNAQGTSTEGFYTITPSGAVSNNYTFIYVDGELQVGNPTIVTYSVEQIDASGSCGGFLKPADSLFSASTTYYGILIDVRNYRGRRLVFTKNTTTGDWTSVRFAFLKSATLTNNVKPTYSSESGFTGVITQEYGAWNTLEYTIPSDASYLFLYTYSNGYNSRASNIAIYGLAPVAEMKNLPASLFAANKQKSIGSDGTLTSYNASVTSDFLDASVYTRRGVADMIYNQFGTGIDDYVYRVGEYDGNKKFIRRDAYGHIPASVSLAPSCAFLRIEIIQKGGEVDLGGDVIRFDGDDIQIEGVQS